MNRPLILHVGMHKSGSSSLQAYLFRHLRDPRFRYVSLSDVNGSRPIQSLVGDWPVAAHTHPAEGIDPEVMRRRAPSFRRSLDRQLARAQRLGATPILSAEDIWFLSRTEVQRLHALFAGLGYQPYLMAYLRPPLAWLGSMFQESLKSGHQTFRCGNPVLAAESPVKPLPPGLDYIGRLGVFAELFGRDHVTVRTYGPHALTNGCVVTDFCHTLGIAMKATHMERVNESLTLDACRFLYAFNRFARQETSVPFWQILRALKECPGPPLRLHPSILTPMQDALRHQLELLRNTWFVDLTDDSALVGHDLLQDESMLETYSPAALEWLALATGARAVEPTAPAVADRVRRLRSPLRSRISGSGRYWRTLLKLRWASR